MPLGISDRNNCFTYMINRSVVQCHHGDSARSVSTFLTLAVTNLLTTRKFVLPTESIFISFVVQNIIMIFNSWKLSFCTVRQKVYTAPAEYFFASYSSIHYLLNLLPLSHAAFPDLNAFLSDWKRMPRHKFSFFRTSKLSSNLASRLPKMHAYSQVKQNH